MLQKLFIKTKQLFLNLILDFKLLIEAAPEESTAIQSVGSIILVDSCRGCEPTGKELEEPTK